MGWTDERVAKLTEMWAEGKSASQIAKELGGITRNAVIGKVHRLKLATRAQSTKKSSSKAEAKAAEKAKDAGEAVKAASSSALPAKIEPPKPSHVGNATYIPPKRPIMNADQPLPPQPSQNEISEEALKNAREVVKQAKRLSLMELTEKTCKWPVGDPSTDDFWFCGLASETGKPYCEVHSAVAFQPTNMRGGRKR